MITYITLGSYFHIYDTIDLLTNRLFDGTAPSGADATDDQPLIILLYDSWRCRLPMRKDLAYGRSWPNLE